MAPGAIARIARLPLLLAALAVGDLVILAFSGGGQGEHERHASGRVLLWGSGSTAGYRGDHQQRA